MFCILADKANALIVYPDYDLGIKDPEKMQNISSVQKSNEKTTHLLCLWNLSQDSSIGSI